MTTFTLDTSGRVECPTSFQPIGWAIWSDLTPFQQGYVEALLRELSERQTVAAAGRGVILSPGGLVERLINTGCFSDLSPEALALILGDCEAAAAQHPGWADRYELGGRLFWEHRQRGEVPGFPPLTVTLSDAGKVCLSPTPNERKREEEG